MAELSPAEETGTFWQGFAGDTFNTAWYLSRCAPHMDVAYCTAIGEDAMSVDLRQFIRDSGIDDSLIRVIPGGTIGLYLVSLHHGERSFTYWRGQSAARRLAENVETFTAGLMAADLVYFSGITLAILPPEDRAALLHSIASAGRSGARVAFDPNLRLQLWPDHQEMTKTVMQAAALCDIALPSFEDEARFFGDETPAATRARYVKAGVGQVVVKNGGGAILWQDGSAKGTIAVDVMPNPVDTTAAGDSLNAGVLAHLVAGSSLVDGLAFGARLARHVVAHRGALVPVPTDLVTARPV